MRITVHRKKETDFIADITFLSSNYSSPDSYLTEKEEELDIESIKENDLADIIKKYRLFVECIKIVEQKKLTRIRNIFRNMHLQSILQQIRRGMNGTYVKKTMIANGAYVKNAAINMVRVNKIVSELKDLREELKTNSLDRHIYTKINVGRTSIVTSSTVQLDADIVTIIQKEPEVRNSRTRNFILKIHMSNVSLSTFFSVNRVNQIFLHFGRVVGFGRIASGPFSIYYGNTPLTAIAADPSSFIAGPLGVVDPVSILLFAAPTGVFIFAPRITRFIIKYKLRKSLSFTKSKMLKS